MLDAGHLDARGVPGACREGRSHEAFGELQQIYSHRLYQRILSITRNGEDTEDEPFLISSTGPSDR